MKCHCTDVIILSCFLLRGLSGGHGIPSIQNGSIGTIIIPGIPIIF